jgi:hypothetical protein
VLLALEELLILNNVAVLSHPVVFVQAGGCDGSKKPFNDELCGFKCLLVCIFPSLQKLLSTTS